MTNPGVSQRPPIRRDVYRPDAARAAPGDLIFAGAQIRNFAVRDDLTADVLRAVPVIADVQPRNKDSASEILRPVGIRIKP